MRLISRYLILLAALLAFTWITIPIRYDVTYPKRVGPKLNNYIDRKYQAEIVDRASDLVLVGDSILVLSIDPDELGKLTGERTYGIGIPGSASAVWYLAMDNVIATSPYKPKSVVIIFRDTILTAPGYRVNGKYFQLLDDLADTDDTVLVDKAFLRLMSPLERWADRYVPLYGSRLRLRETVDYYIRYSLPGLFGCDAACNDQANIAVFQDLNFDNALLVEAIATAESYLYTPDQLDFDAQIDDSFLPDILQLAKENNIQLILVRTKHLNYPTEASEPLALREYMQKLKAYAVENDVTVLDFAHDERLTPNLYADSHHLTEEGMALFTQMLAEALQPVLNK